MSDEKYEPDVPLWICVIALALALLLNILGDNASRGDIESLRVLHAEPAQAEDSP